MGSDVKKAYGAVGRDELLWFEPEHVLLVEDAEHPLFDERMKLPLDEALTKNIMARGIVEPIIVRKNGERDGKPVVEVVDGRQRVRAAREANKRLAAQGAELVRVPAVRMRGDDADLLGVMISANEMRRDDTPLVRAKKCARYLALGRTVADASEAYGVSVVTIRAWMALIECSAAVQKAVEKGEVAATVAVQLAKLPREEQGPALDKLKADGVTKGKRGAQAAAEATGRTVKRMLNRREVKALREVLADTEERDAPSAFDVLGYVLKGSVPKKFQVRA